MISVSFLMVEVDSALHYKGTLNNKGNLWWCWAFQTAIWLLLLTQFEHEVNKEATKSIIKIVLTQSFDLGCQTFLSCRDSTVDVLFILGVFNFKYFFPLTPLDSLGTEFFFISTERIWTEKVKNLLLHKI